MKVNTIQLKRTVSAVLFVLLLSAVGMTNALAFTVGKLNYSINSDGVSVTVTGHVNGTAATGELVIPETVTYNGSTYSVSTIGSHAFLQCSGFTGNLVIPNSVTTIGEFAFYGCTGFTGNLVIPSSVTSIAGRAFSDCYGFTGNLVIPNSVTTIGTCAFDNCTGFTGDLVIPNSVNIIEWGAFSGCSGFTGDLVIPNSVTSIGTYAFSGCSGFTGDLVIPNSVTTIGTCAFDNCTGFTGDLVIPNSVTTIGYAAFEYCNGFTGNLTIGSSVNTIGTNAFYGCSGFTGNLVIPNSVTTIGEWAFNNCTGFTGNLIIGSSVTTIGSYAFCYCEGLTGNLVIPNSVTTIGDHAFYHCTGFTGNLVIPNSVTTIGGNAFGGCTGFSSVEYNATNCTDASSSWPPFRNCGVTLTIGENVERIPANMFKWAAFTGSLIIPNSVTSIGEWAFHGCTGFTGDLVIPNSVTTIGEAAFRSCTNFSTVEYNATDCADLSSGSPFLDCGGTLTIGENVERIPAQMFSNAAFTGSLIIPNSVTTIGYNAFRECTGFTGNLVISNSVTAIGEYAFKDCTGFSSVEYNATDCADASVYSPFENCGSTLTIGENVERIPARMFSNAAFTLILSYAEIPPTVGIYAFYGIDHDIPVYVPCGSLSDYQNADGWNEFNNIFSNNCFEITVTVTPANSGTVTGAGTYNHGATATLMAAANTGYAFIKWTKDGTVVSTNPTYSFTVTEDVDLVANFKLPGDANGDGIVDALDIVVIVNHIFGLPTEEFVFDNADVNGDGVVDALDIVIIVNIIFSKNS